MDFHNGCENIFFLGNNLTNLQINNKGLLSINNKGLLSLFQDNASVDALKNSLRIYVCVWGGCFDKTSLVPSIYGNKMCKEYSSWGLSEEADDSQVGNYSFNLSLLCW